MPEALVCVQWVDVRPGADTDITTLAGNGLYPVVEAHILLGVITTDTAADRFSTAPYLCKVGIVRVVDIRALKRRASELRKFRLREPQRTIARILVAMHHGEPTAAMGYIQSKRKGKGLDHTMATQAEAELREWWRGADSATKQSHRVKEGASIKMLQAGSALECRCWP